MSPDSTPPDAALLSTLRARQAASRTAQVARALGESTAGQTTGGAFNASAAAALDNWKKL